jgi:hypothetical protein
MVENNHYFEEFEVGARYATTSRLVTLDDHLDFCKLVRYEVPMFIDEEAGAKTEYAGMICPSHLIMSFTTAMTGALFSKSIIGLLAIEGARFFAPVRPGDTLRTEVEILNKRLTSDGNKGVVTFRDYVYNQFDKLVFQNDKIALIKCKSAIKSDTALN